jgi:hypothetical protein
MWLQFAMMFALVHMPGSGFIMRQMMKSLSDIELPDYPLSGPVPA